MLRVIWASAGIWLSAACGDRDRPPEPKAVATPTQQPAGAPAAGGPAAVSLSDLSRSMRIVPEIRDGKATGFRLYSVQPDGACHRLGLRNGDIIRAVGGVKVTSPESALEGYSRMKGSSDPTVTVERDGQQLELHIDWNAFRDCQSSGRGREPQR